MDERVHIIEQPKGVLAMKTQRTGQFTKGPWHNDSTNYGYGPLQVCGPRLADGSDYAPICTANTEANAVLIAAAPDLLEALEYLDKQFGHKFNNETADIVEAALAKAGR